MSEHTPGPWTVNPECLTAVIKAGGSKKSIANATDFSPNCSSSEYDERDANARRIVVCVNACEGLSSEALERLGTLDRASVAAAARRNEMVIRLHESNAELLEALKDLREAIQSRGVVSTVKALKKTDAAIAKAEGGAA